MKQQLPKSVPLHALKAHRQLVRKVFDSSRTYMDVATAFSVAARYVAVHSQPKQA